MRRVLAFQFKKLLLPAVLLAVLFALLNAGAVYLFDEETVSAISEARGKNPLVFSALGIGGSATLGSHLASLLYGLLLPLLGGLYAVRLSSALIADKLETGEVCYWLSLPISRARFVLGQWALLAALLLLPPLGGYVGGVVAAFILRPDAALHPVWHALLNAGLYAWTVLAGTLGLLISSGEHARKRAHRISVLLFLLFVAVGAAGATVGVPKAVGWLSPWRFFTPQALAVGRVPAQLLVLPAITLVLLGLSAFRFSKIEIE